MASYKNIYRNPVFTGNGTVCRPGEIWVTSLDLHDDPRFECVKATKKKATKKKAAKK